MKYSTVVLLNGIIYCFPGNAGSVGMIDTEQYSFGQKRAEKWWRIYIACIDWGEGTGTPY